MNEQQLLNTRHRLPLTSPPLGFELRLWEYRSEIEGWFEQQWRDTPAPFYASVDLRNSGFKLAPVDTNLFPAGFNNLDPSFLLICSRSIKQAIYRICTSAHSVLLIPENHTRNLFYQNNIIKIREILLNAGFAVHLGSIPQPGSSGDFSSTSIRRVGNRIWVGDHSPCLILLNNDLAGGRPPILEGLEQPLAPPLGLGWSERLKSDHFAEYRQVTREFSLLTGFDSWLLDPLFSDCSTVDFMAKIGEECLADKVAELLAAIQHKYNEYKIEHKPFVVIKADRGTYGMGVMTARSPADLKSLNRRQRTKMSTSKGGIEISRVILQEGVYSFEKWEAAVAEPVVYLIDKYLVGSFYRVHPERKVDENLNAPGMHFEPLTAEGFIGSGSPELESPSVYAYGVVARLALVAAARELARTASITC